MKWVFGTLLLAMIPVLAWVGVARAQHFTTTVEDDQIIYSSVYSAGKEVNIKGTVYGDVYCAGQKIVVSATVYGDVICAGVDVTISGKVEGDIRLGGQLVTVSGQVGKSATVAAVNFSLDADAKIGQDLTAAGEIVNVKGSVGRDIVASGNKAIFNGSVGRNIRTTSADVQLKEGARIAGGLHYSSQRDAAIAQGAEVKGKVEHQTPPQRSGFNFTLYLFAVVSLTLVGTILALLFPRFMRKASDQLDTSIPKTMVYGLLGTLAVLALCIGLLLSLIGVPLALILLFAGVGGAILSGPIVAYYVGTLVFRKTKDASPVVIALVGGPILITAYYLPFIGILILIGAYLLGFGALIRTIQPYVGKLSAAATSRKK